MRPRREPFVDGLQRPEIGVGRILEKFADAGHILGADHFHEVRHRPDFEIARVIVAAAESEFAAAVALVESQAQWKAERTDAERAVVEPIVAHPAIDHRALCDHCLKCRVRVDQRHQRREAQVARTDDADVTVRLRRVLHQPFNGVVGIGRFVYAGFIQWSRERAIEDPLSLGPMHAADVLVHADVVVFDKFRVHYFEYVDDALAIDAARRTARVIGSAR